MSEEAPVITQNEVAAEAKLSVKRHKLANRIAKRVMKKIQKGHTEIAVKPGPLGVLKSSDYDREVLPNVDNRLREHGVEMEAYNVYTGNGGSYDDRNHDVIAVTGINGKKTPLSSGLKQSRKLHPPEETKAT